MGRGRAYPGLPLLLYRAGVAVIRPGVPLLLAYRARAGKEDRHRLKERYGETDAIRPQGPLVWLHAASVGESVSALPLITVLRSRGLQVLLTTGTVTSARLMRERLPQGTIHQYAPLDHPGFVKRFLRHWRPEAALFLESELWPHMLRLTKRAGIPAALVNARLSEASFKGWQRAAATAASLLGLFDIVLAQDARSAERLTALGAHTVETRGNLKWAAPPLPADADEVARFKTAIGGRPVWIAASTHEGEDEQIADAHRIIARDVGDVLTIIAPRHPQRGRALARLLEADGLRPACRSAGHMPDPGVALYLADTIGELGLFYRLTDIAFVGASLVERGGHNPLEPARLGCTVLFGPHMENFTEPVAELLEADAGLKIDSTEQLAAAVLDALKNPQETAEKAARARKAAEDASGVLDRIVASLDPILPAAEPRHDA